MKNIRSHEGPRQRMPFQGSWWIPLAIGLLFATCLVARVPLTQTKTSTPKTVSATVVRRYPTQDDQPKQFQDDVDLGSRPAAAVLETSHSQLDVRSAAGRRMPASGVDVGSPEMASVHSQPTNHDDPVKDSRPPEDVTALLGDLRQWVQGIQTDRSSRTHDPRREPSAKDIKPQGEKAGDARDRSVAKTSSSQRQARQTQEPDEQFALRLTNPSGMTIEVHYVVDGREHYLMPGQSHVLTGGQSWRIQFHRGGDFGYAQYVLRSGSYVFTVTDEGWGLSEKDGTF